MQHTTLPDRDTTGRTRHGGYLFGREFALFHYYRMRIHALANLFNFGLCLNFSRILHPRSTIPNEEEQRMSEVLEGLLQKRASLAAELGALDAGIAAYRRALAPTKSVAAVQVNGTRPTMSLAARKKLSVLAKARWAKKRKEDKK